MAAEAETAVSGVGTGLKASRPRPIESLNSVSQASPLRRYGVHGWHSMIIVVRPP